MNTMYDFAFSEQGYNHIKVDKVCQDSSGHYSDDSMAIVVVADGHGSDNYPRTDRGSSFAVEAAIHAIRKFVKSVEENAIDISEESDLRLEQLAKNILANWYAAVETDVEKYPFSEEELEKVSEKYKKRYLSGKRQEKAYGTTLIAVCQTRTYWFGIQIGDGKCVCISTDGTISEPIPWDEDCQANITTSICDSDAIEEFRYCFMADPPIATLIGSDGIDDSYANTEELYVLYRSILAIFAECGQTTGEEEVQGFLPNLSRKGSGDDVSIAGIVATTLTPAFIEVLKAQCEYANAEAQKTLAGREVTLAEEKYVYVCDAMTKAKANYDLCAQKAEEAKKSIESAQNVHEEAVQRLNTAIMALEDAMRAYQDSLIPASIEESSIVETEELDTVSEQNVESAVALDKEEECGGKALLSNNCDTVETELADESNTVDSGEISNMD